MAATIKINRAPVLTLWAAVVAERLGFDRATALDARAGRGGPQRLRQGRVAGHHRAQARLVREQGERLAEGEQLHVDLLGRAVPVVRTPDGLRAVSKGKPGNPAQIEKYLAGKFGERLETARQAMAELAAAHEPADLYRRGFRLYERFRPACLRARAGGAPRASWICDRVRVGGERIASRAKTEEASLYMRTEPATPSICLEMLFPSRPMNHACGISARSGSSSPREFAPTSIPRRLYRLARVIEPRALGLGGSTSAEAPGVVV